MKIIIDIPKEQYTTLNAKTQDDIVDVIDHGLLIKAIENGTPIQEGQYDSRTVDRVLEIIDNTYDQWIEWSTNDKEKLQGAKNILRRRVLALKGEQE